MSENAKHVANFIIVYFFLVVVFYIIVILNQINQTINVINHIFAIMFLLIYPLFYCVILHGSKKCKEEDEIKEYYETQFPDVNSLKKVNKSALFECKVALYILIVITVLGMIYANRNTMKIFLERFSSIIDKNVSISVSIVMGVYAVLFTFFPIITSCLKDKCLFFRPFDIQMIDRSRLVTIISLIIAMIYVILTLCDAGEWLKGADAVSWIILITINVIIYLKIFLIPGKIEKNVLKKIHHLFSRKRIYMTPNIKWWKGSVIKQMAYLLRKYEKSLGKVNGNGIEDIEFACVFSKTKENVDLAQRKFYVLSGRCIVFTLAFGFAISQAAYSKAMQIGLYWGIILVALMPLLLPVLDHCVIINNYAYINRIGYKSIWGYYVKQINRTRRIYISTYDFSFSKYKKCLINLKRLVCFYNLAINMKYEDTEYIDDIGIECLCDYIKDLSRRESYKQGMLVPILICACLSEHKKDESTTIIKGMLRYLQISSEEQFKSVQVSLQVVRNLYGNDSKFDKEKYEKELEGLFH